MIPAHQNFWSLAILSKPLVLIRCRVSPLQTRSFCFGNRDCSKSSPARPQAGRRARRTSMYVEAFEQRERSWRAFGTVPQRTQNHFRLCAVLRVPGPPPRIKMAQKLAEFILGPSRRTQTVFDLSPKMWTPRFLEKFGLHICRVTSDRLLGHTYRLVLSFPTSLIGNPG